MSQAIFYHFEKLHEMKPAPFNPDYRPYAKKVALHVAKKMRAQGVYDKHTREECAAIHKKRYRAIMDRLELAWQKTTEVT